ncbi:hypothetical protein DV096_09120 [Bradymonadaceae bacterium TMQ3]|uniref:SnoaL-like domain-containing protein n=1 Tax=Lujinxingia sediminis TaxID=2480984 RepID=A0ABY0CU64_9DELT|nr:hypothetical protein [Lujinxingia sediminis]RDV38941.1 hypothetical protein DV096_09120 [Bradymonadaceae bacterium TMQ3]RVU44176.1 hypothetical protein EA187_11560 [Lujinxingia sediminis]TXC76286.1 hypothetical protein FRC91_05950 [Bradymonadales bacterium TMQ1]
MFYAPLDRCRLVALALAIAGCSDPQEFARIEADDLSRAPDCAAAQFPMEPELLALRPRVEKLGLFLQSAPDIQARHDVLYIELSNPEDDLIGRDLLIDPGNPEADARARLAFFSSCFPAQESYDVRGTLRFDLLERETSGVVAGELTDALALDARSGEVVIEGLRASWSFLVRRGPPYEDFYALPESP